MTEAVRFRSSYLPRHEVSCHCWYCIVGVQCNSVVEMYGLWWNWRIKNNLVTNMDYQSGLKNQSGNDQGAKLQNEWSVSTMLHSSGLHLCSNFILSHISSCFESKQLQFLKWIMMKIASNIFLAFSKVSVFWLDNHK